MSMFDLLGNQLADMEAINDFFLREHPKTNAATKLKADWITWYNGLGPIEIRTDSAVIQEATNRRNAYNVANTQTPDELKALKEALARAPSREEQQGLPRATDSAGNYVKAPGVTVASAAKGSVPKGARPTIRQGDVGEGVKAWQTLIGVEPADGRFGPATKAATIEWQKKHNLTADGVVGSATWGTALGGKSADPMPFEQAATVPVAPIGNVASATPTGHVAQVASLKVQPKPNAVPKPMPEVARKAAVPAKSVTPVSKNVDPELRKDVGVPAAPAVVAKPARALQGKGTLVAGGVGAAIWGILKALV